MAVSSPFSNPLPVQWEVLEGYRTDSPGWDWVAVDGMLCTCFSQPMKGLEAPCMPEQVEHGSLGPYKLKHGYKAHKLMDLRVHRIYVLPCEG